MKVMNKGISIVIITHDREQLVKRCIESVLSAIQRYDGETEIIVVNSSKGLVAESWKQIKEIHVPDIPKPYKKRNIGLKESKYDWILYLDDDCVVDKNIFNILDRNLANAPADVGGFYGVTEFTGDMTYASKCCRHSNFTNIFELPKYQKELAWGVAVSPLFRKEALVKCDGFATVFTSSVGGEDLDLGVKLNEHGWRLLGIPDTLSYHEYETWNSYTGNLKRFFRYGMAETSVVLNHPKHIFFKLNCMTLLLLPILADLVLSIGSAKAFFARLALYLVFTTSFSAIYYRFNNKVPLYQAYGVVIYDRSFEFGVMRSSFMIHKFKTLFYRFEYQKKQRLFGHDTKRNILIAVEWLSIILAFICGRLI